MTTTITTNRNTATKERLGELLAMRPGQLRAHITADLTDLTAEAYLVQTLTNTHQRNFDFLTGDGKAAREIQNAKDRRDQAIRQKKGEPLGHGPIATPGNVNAISLDDTTRRSLRALIRTMTAALFRAGLCVLERMSSTPTTAQLTDHLAHLVTLAPDDAVPALATVALTVEQLQERLTTFIDGNDRSQTGFPCPHCQLDTLVYYWRDRRITCEKTATSTHYEPCVCPDPLCACKANPTGHRHTWLKSKSSSKADSWDALAGRLGIQRRATTPKPRKKRKSR